MALGLGSAVLKACLRMDPEVTFLPEEIQTGYTQSMNATYMKTLEAKGLSWEPAKREGNLQKPLSVLGCREHSEDSA